MQRAYTSKRLQYSLFRPERPTEKALPLILFPDGCGERDDPAQIKKWGLPTSLDDRPDFPSLDLSPLCPADVRWTDLDPAVIDLRDQAMVATGAASNRIDLTGFSMGGQGAWHLAVEYPALCCGCAGPVHRIFGVGPWPGSRRSLS